MHTHPRFCRSHAGKLVALVPGDGGGRPRSGALALEVVPPAGGKRLAGRRDAHRRGGNCKAEIERTLRVIVLHRHTR